MDDKEWKTNLDCDLIQLIHQCSSSSFKICHDYLDVALTLIRQKFIQNIVLRLYGLDHYF